VLTWRDGVLPSAEEKARLTPSQLRQYPDDSVVRDLSEIEKLPEPMRSRMRRMVAEARAWAEERIAAEDRPGREAHCPDDDQVLGHPR
jgi:hypothetical protein